MKELEPIPALQGQELVLVLMKPVELAGMVWEPDLGYCVVELEVVAALAVVLDEAVPMAEVVLVVALAADFDFEVGNLPVFVPEHESAVVLLQPSAASSLFSFQYCGQVVEAFVLMSMHHYIREMTLLIDTVILPNV